MNIIKCNRVNYDIDSMTTQELRELEIAIKENIANIKNQIEEAAIRFSTTGVPSDPQWLRRANAALRGLGVSHQSVMLQIGKIKRNRIGTIDAAFVDIAKRRLQKDVFLEMMTEAQDMVANHE